MNRYRKQAAERPRSAGRPTRIQRPSKRERSGDSAVLCRPCEERLTPWNGLRGTFTHHSLQRPRRETAPNCESAGRRLCGVQVVGGSQRPYVLPRRSGTERNLSVVEPKRRGRARSIFVWARGRTPAEAFVLTSPSLLVHQAGKVGCCVSPRRHTRRAAVQPTPKLSHQRTTDARREAAKAWQILVVGTTRMVGMPRRRTAERVARGYADRRFDHPTRQVANGKLPFTFRAIDASANAPPAR
jgi:hypothetical protein